MHHVNYGKPEAGSNTILLAMLPLVTVIVLGLRKHQQIVSLKSLNHQKLAV